MAINACGAYFYLYTTKADTAYLYIMPYLPLFVNILLISLLRVTKGLLLRVTFNLKSIKNALV